MQNVQNADIQRVMNLVDFYRTKVGNESQMAKDLAEEYKRQYDDEIDFAYSLHEKGIEGYCLDIRIPEEAVDEIRANEQLLGHFYKEVAGDDADSDVLRHLLADKYDKTIFSDEEESFLKIHFADMVNYIIQTPNNNLKAVEQDDRRDLFLLPKEVLDLIKSRVEIPNGAKVYNPFTGLAQFTTLYSGCSFYCEDSYYSYSKRWNEYCDKLRKEANIVEGKINKDMVWPWMKVAIFANQIDAEIIEDGKVPQRFDAVVSYLPYIPTAVPNATSPRTGEETDEPEIINKIQSSYKGLDDGGKMALILPKEYFWKSDSSSLRSLWSKIIEDGALVEIIQIPAVMGKNLGDGDYCIIIAEKGQNKKMTTLIDARFAAKDSVNMCFDQYLDLASLNSVLRNEGKEESTGLRKAVQVPMKDLNVDFLAPQVYVIERPSENEHPLPLSELGSFASTRIRNLDFDLPEDTPWVELKDLSRSFKGDFDIATLKKADCPNNPVFIEGSKDYAFSSTGKFIDSFWAQMGTVKGRRVNEYRRCTYLDGNKDAVLFRTSQKGVATAIIRATNKPIAIGQGIKVFIPKDSVDALTIVALLKLPVVHRQIQTYTEFGLEKYLDNILVPSDKRIIHDEEQNLLNEGMVISELENNLKNIRKSVRMRKHALTQSLSSLEAMFYALNAFRERKDGQISDDDVISRVKGTTVRDAFEYLSKGLKGMMPVLEHIADVEYTFNKPEWIDPEIFIEDYIAKKEKGWLNFKPVITWEKGNNQAKGDVYAFTNTQPSRKELALKKGQSIRQFLFPKDALEHIFKNIISNAQSWAFNDKSREDYQLKFSWHIGDKGKTLVIEIENNGTPIPEDRDTTSLLEYGVSTALHHDGHNGIGCNEIDDIMQRYDGKVEIVSTPQSVFTVKYILTFNHIDDMGSKYLVIKPVM